MAIILDFTLYYITEHGIQPDPKLVNEGETFENYLPKLTADGYSFIGWYTSPTFEEDTKVSKNDILLDPGEIGYITLYAKWLKNAVTVNSKMTALADEIRILSGTTEKLGLDAMATNVGEANSLIDTQFDLITQIKNAVNSLPDANDTSDATATASTILNGYTAYVDGEKITGTIQSQAAQTIIPSTTDKTIAAGKYLAGTQTIKGDANLIASNIKSGVSIFGVSGNLSSGGDSNEDALVARTITNYDNNSVKTIGDYTFYSYSSLATVSAPICNTIGAYAFANCYSLTTASFFTCTTICSCAFSGCSNLTTILFTNCIRLNSSAFAGCKNLVSVNFPRASSIGTHIFNYCNKLTTANFPKAPTVADYQFRYCSALTTISFPVASNIGAYAFLNCSSLSTVSFPKATTIGSNAFNKCTNLKSLYLTGSKLCTLSSSDAFTSTPIGGYSKSAGTYGSIYVPTSMLTSYKAATNWTYFSSRFVGV